MIVNSGFNKATLELFIDDDTNAEFAGLQNFKISEIYTDYSWHLPKQRWRCSNISKLCQYITSIDWKDNLIVNAIHYMNWHNGEMEKEA